MCPNQEENQPLHLVWVFPSGFAGRYNIAPRLEITRELRQLGWDVTLIAAGPAGVQRYLDVDVHCIPMLNKYLLRQIVFHIRVIGYLLRYLDTIDVILFHQMSAPWILLLSLKRYFVGNQSPLFVMDTRTVPMELKSKARISDRIRGAYHHSMSWISHHLTDGETAITKRMADETNIPHQKLWGTWPSGVNLERFEPAQTPRHWPQEVEPIHLIYVGVLHYARNLMPLCKAVEKANIDGMAFVLTLVGFGSQQKELEKFALQTNGQVRVRAPVPHEQVPNLLAKAHTGVLPFPDEQKFQVSSPIKLFEYMGAGLPILATRIVCHTDVIGDGGYVFWAEDASIEGLYLAICNVWNNRNSLTKMGAKSALAAELWTWRRSAEKLKAALEYGILAYSQ